MSSVELFWQRERPLADFRTGNKSNLILVTTERGIRHVIDDIFDDVRNDVLQLLTVGRTEAGTVHLSSLEKNGLEVKEDHGFLVNALSSAHREISAHAGSVIIINTVGLVIDSISRSAITAFMNAKDVHVVLLATIEGIESLQDYLSLDANVTIDVQDKVETLAF